MRYGNLEDLDEIEEETDERMDEESGGGGGDWKSNLFGGLTQRVKSWYWGSSPLVSLFQNSLLDDAVFFSKKKKKSAGECPAILNSFRFF